MAPLGLLLALLLPVAEGPSLPPPDGVPLCTTAAYVDWQKLRLESAGVRGTSGSPYLAPDALVDDDCDGPVDFSESQEGRARDGIHAWVFADRCKRTLCGYPHDFDPNYRSSFLSGEFDLNNNVFPDGHFLPFLERQQCFVDEPGRLGDLALEGSSLCLQKPASGWLLHVEITPAPGPVRRQLLRLWEKDSDYARWRSGLWSSLFCVHGPFVADTGHGAKAEIHPTELFWWNASDDDRLMRDPFAPDGPFDLFLVQDASGRFNKENFFIMEKELPENPAWRPWAKAPLSGTFEIAFFARTAEEAQFTIQPFSVPEPGQEVRARRVGDGAEPRQVAQKAARADAPLASAPDALPPPPHVFVPATARQKVEAHAQWLCRCDTTTCDREHEGYLGKLTVTGTVGIDRDFEEGALALRVFGPPRPRSRAAAPVVEAALTTAGSAESRDLVGQLWWIGEKWAETDASSEDLLGLFSAAGWPTDVPRPTVEKLLRPRKLRLDARSQLTGLPEAEAGKTKVEVTWKAAQACSVDPARTCDDIQRRLRGRGEQRRLDLPLDASGRPREVVVQVSWKATGGSAGTLLLTDEASPRLWTHAFVVKDRADWLRSALALCTRSRNGRQETYPSKLETLLRRAVSRGLVSVTSLAQLVRATRQECTP